MTVDADLTPLAGSPAGLADLAGAATRAARALAGARDDLARLDGLLVDHRSAAVRAARERLAATRGDVVLCADVLGTVAGVLARRSDELRAEQDDAARALTARADAQARLDRAEADEALALGADPLAPLADAARQAWDARVRAALAPEDVAAADRAWHRARDAKDAASRRAAPLLDGLAEARAVAVSAAHGVGAGDHAEAWRLGTDLAARVPGVLGVTGDARDAARTDLFAAIVAADGDPARWPAFWDAVRPADLLTALGTDPPSGVVHALAGGLTVWASSATAGERHRLGGRVVEGVGRGHGTADRAARLGEILGSTPLPAAVWSGAADALVGRRRTIGPDDVDATDLAPVAVAIATGLSRHPRAALDHLGAGAPAEVQERAHVWFGTTPPDGWADGGTAVTGMLAAAVAVGSRSDLPTQRRTALAVSAATTELTGDRGLLTVGSGNGPVSDTARAHVVDVYRPYLESVGENVAQAGDAGTPGVPALLTVLGPDRSARDTLAPGVDLPWSTAQPQLDAFALRTVVAATSATAPDADRWLRALDDHVTRTVVLATGSGLDGEDRKTVVTTALADVAFVAGAIQSPVIGDAEAAAGRAGSTAAGAALGLGVASAPASTALSLAATAVGSILPGLVPDPVAEARATVLRTEPLLRDRFAGPLYRAVVDQDVADGAPPEQAARENAALHPDGAELGQDFGTNYDLGARLGRRLGENT